MESNQDPALNFLSKNLNHVNDFNGFKMVLFFILVVVFIYLAHKLIKELFFLTIIGYLCYFLMSGFSPELKKNIGQTFSHEVSYLKKLSFRFLGNEFRQLSAVEDTPNKTKSEKSDE